MLQCIKIQICNKYIYKIYTKCRIIATPGRILHVLTEMSIKLDKLKIIVYDEADR